MNNKSPNYSYDFEELQLLDHARKTTKLPSEGCIQGKSDGCEDERRLHKELEDLDANFVNKHFVNTGEKMVKYAKSHVFVRLTFS